MSRVRSLVIIALVAITTMMCVRDDLETCGTMSCPVGDVCTVGGCASPEAATACADKQDGVACTTSTIASGTCGLGACHAAVCGNSILDLGEVCDDGNTIGADSCSSDCMSLETCGNNRVDTIVGEQCDVGILGLSGDGCTSACGTEFDFWREVTPPPPSPRAFHALATDPDPRSATGVRGVLSVGGGLGSGSFLDGGSAAFDETMQWDGTSWVEPPTPTPQIKRASFAMAFDELRRRVVVFGGVDQDGKALGDTWEWDGVTWNDRTPFPPSNTNSPTPRLGGQLACDKVRAKCVLFGGRKSLVETFDDTWEWDGTTWTERPKIQPYPLAREHHAMAYDGTRVVMYGGTGSAQVTLGDTWTYDGMWTQVVSAGPQPPASARPVAAHDPVAGATFFILNNQTWRFDGTWSNFGVPPLLLSDPKLAFDPARNRIVAFGDRSTSDVRELDTSEVAPYWRLIQPRRPAGPQGNSTAAYDAARGRVVLFGATGTWEWTGVAWVLRSGLVASTAPTPTNDAAMVYDSARREIVLFGGRQQLPNNQTWGYDGSKWVQHTPVNRPLPRYGHAMTYDAGRNVTVMHGGFSTLGAAPNLADTAEWDGVDWVAKSSTMPGPKLNEFSAMAYDVPRKVSVLFGTSLLGVGETWEWDGTSWIKRTPILSPPRRSRHGLAYDPLRRRVVAFGGSGASAGDDTWEWNAAANTWRRLSPLISPSPRSGMLLVPDITGGLIAFGGNDVYDDPLTETWRLRFESGVSSPERCARATEDSDGDGLAGCADPDCWRRCASLCAPGDSCAPSAQRCGDNVCSAIEDHVICPADCTPP